MDEAQLSSEKADIIDDIGTADDSGFASISVPVATENTEPLDTIAGDVRINNGTFENLAEKKLRVQPIREMNLEKKRLAEEEYNEKIRETQYKRLMHLLDRSQFYSKYLVNKMNQEMKKEAKKRSPDKRKKKRGDENSPPTKIQRKITKSDEESVVREYVKMKDEKGKKGRKNLDLSQDEISTELETEESESLMSQDSNGTIALKYFKGELRDYQIEGLKWLRLLYENGLNGILADEMGLGKTIQIIALICHLIEKKVPGPYLIVAPLSTIPNWLIEFERFAPQIPVVLFHGPSDERSKLYNKIEQKRFSVDGFKTQPVVMTTYEVPLFEEKFMKKQQWRYIIIDEGQRIKNHKCQLVQVLKACMSMNRLLLTGTPLQNNLSELWSLLNFLLPDIFDDLAVFESWFDAKELQNDRGTKRILEQESEKRVLSSLREILKPFMLRRVKTDVCLEIPPRKEVVVYAPLTELQHNLYKAVLTRDIELLSKIHQEDPIIPDVNGQRPKRRARIKAEQAVGAMYAKKSDISYSRASTPSDEEDVGRWKENSLPDENLSIFKQYTDIEQRNQDFFIRTQFVKRDIMYKKIVNHPYLVHCPLNDVGLPRIDDELINSSGKLLVLDAMLLKLKARGHKVLLFSTWTAILDMLEDYAELRNFRYERLDGNCNIESRKTSIASFNSNPEVFIFLISTRAGGVGLNLTGADTVVMYDSDWNPQADIQAMARCHRIGQTRPVVVYKLCTKGTIDESIMGRAEAKRKLEKMVISEDIPMNLNKVETLIKLQKLLKSTENLVVKSKHDVFTHKELDDLLDRSDLMPKAAVEDRKKAPVRNKKKTDSNKDSD